MSSKMLKFVSTEKAMPEKRKAEKRVADFDEIYDDFDAAEAETQSSRCSQCLSLTHISEPTRPY